MASNSDLAKAARALSRADPVLRDVIKKVGPITLRPPGEPFPSLVRSIFYQQLAGPAAAAILRRFLALYGDGAFPAPQQVLETSDEQLRSAGLSRQKLGYLRDLSAKFADGTLSNEKLRSLPDDELEKALMSVKGIGRWTADMFLMNVLHRLDILAVDDLGLRKGAQQAFGLETTPTPKELLALGERWRPYRSLAALYLWRSLDGRPPRPPEKQAVGTPEGNHSRQGFCNERCIEGPAGPGSSGQGQDAQESGDGQGTTSATKRATLTPRRLPSPQ
ncbi:MAG: DNA-3-methyladenine glycosylase 2 family protein [Dehalococcoidia bacterium]|nr:DNA-3-methyladenine glycosylase 2 family protein [Dehalococcoidia bacterium]